ncbi:SDR family oxidoreductase [Dactylosporangium fulvum]|uniref:NAD(P)H-binding protein n=1 Tax=Dactylosporangium fulvum TaxID=53359 RepID=A0ABY5VV15_9ACTN|nr:NAD(P)H-binding protein [Dactylosporangium fulvum]UWP80979.1 NAD(P)H-binding protein [Dactylosporangium fulvum]
MSNRIPAVAVTGGAGALGSAVVRHLYGKATPIVVTRRPEDVVDGAEVRRADFDDIDPSAFAGAERALIISTDHPDNVRRAAQHRAAIDAAVAAGVRHLVYTSLVGCDGPPDLLNAAHRETEAHLRASGVPWTAVRNNLYAEGLAGMQAAAAATGRHVTNTGDGAVAYVDRDHCAQVAATVLLGEPQGVVEVHGPRPLDAVALAALFSRRLGRPIEPVLLDDDAYRAHLLGAGTPPPLVTALIALGQAVRAGVYAGHR